MSLLYEWLDNAAGARGQTMGGGQALIYRDTYLSWHGLRHRVNRRATELKGFGIEAGDWVGLMLGSVPEFVVLALALSKLDAVVVPLDPVLGGRDLDMVFTAAQLRALVTRPNALTPFAAPAVDLSNERPRTILESRRRVSGTLLTCATFERRSIKLPAGVVPEVVLFTLDGGGDPKGVVRERRQLEGIGAAFASTLDIDAETRVSAAAGLHASQGFDLGFCAALAKGAGLVLDDELVAARLAKLLSDQGADVLAATPALFAAMARLPTAKPCGSLHTRCVSSGEPLTPTVARAFRKRFKVPLLSCYQAMETGPVAIDRDGRNSTTVGLPFVGVEIRVADRQGAAMPAGTRGSVWVRCAGVSTTFVPSLSLRMHGSELPIGRGHSDGWLRTGDVGSLDRDGRLTLCGREDDLVKVDGRRVALGEVEGCLEAFANVRSAEARLEYDEHGGSRVIARVQRDGHCTPKQLIDHCARHLAPHKVPARVEVA